MGRSLRSWSLRRWGRRQLLIFDNGADGSVRSAWGQLGTNWGWGSLSSRRMEAG